MNFSNLLGLLKFLKTLPSDQGLSFTDIKPDSLKKTNMTENLIQAETKTSFLHQNRLFEEKHQSKQCLVLELDQRSKVSLGLSKRNISIFVMLSDTALYPHCS